MLRTLNTSLKSALVASTLFVGAQFTSAQAADLSNGVVKIGIVNDQTGPLADPMGPGSVVAARLAVEDFKKLNPDIKVEIVTADHQNKPDVGAVIVRKWLDVDGVDMVADVGNSAVGLAVQSIVRDKHKIAIYAAVATTELTGKQCVPTGLAWLHDSYNLVSGPINDLVPKGYKTWYFIAADYAFGRNMVEESRKLLDKAGGKAVGSIFHPMAETDYTSHLLQAQSSGAKVIAFANTGQQLVNSMKQWAEFGMADGPQKPVAELVFLTDIHSMGLKVAKGLTAITAWYWGLNDETRAFAKRFNAVHGAMPTEAQASVYSGVFHYLKSVAAAGSDATDAVLQKMRATPVDDFYARGATLREDNKLVHNFYLVQVKDEKDFKNPWEYYNVLRTIPPEVAYPPLSDSECPLVNKKKS